MLHSFKLLTINCPIWLSEGHTDVKFDGRRDICFCKSSSENPHVLTRDSRGRRGVRYYNPLIISSAFTFISKHFLTNVCVACKQIYPALMFKEACAVWLNIETKLI